MNRIAREIFALRKVAGIYLKYRQNPVSFAYEWMLEKKGEDYINWYHNERSKLIQYKNKHQGLDCFIIGNGPSLNKMDLTLLNDYYTFGLNKIFLIFNRVDLSLDYLVSVNPLVIEQSIDQFNSLGIPKFISYLGSKNLKTDSETYKIYTTGGISFSDEITRPICEGFTVTNVALQVAYYMGFRRVFLIGVDHNFNQKGKPNEEQVMKEDDVNHFDPNYFKGMQWHLADLEGSEIAYRNTGFFFDRSNRKIYDATLDGKLKVFDKITFDEALKLARKK